MSSLYEAEIFMSGEEMPMHPGGLRLTDRAARLAGLAAGMRAADLGCGTGAAAAFLTNKYGLQVIGIDISEKLLAAGIAKHPGIALLCGDCRTLPFADGSLDAALLECSLSVIGEPAAVLGECARALRPEGTLILSDVVANAGTAPNGVLLTADTLCALLEQSGFSVVIREDHTPALKAYAASLYECGGTGLGPGAFFDGKCVGGTLRLKDLGYLLVIARKQ